MKYFYKDIELDVPDSVYYPKEDSELLIEVIQKIDIKGKNILEIGCGSGLLSIIMARKGAKVTATDINPDAIEAAEINAEKNGANILVLLSNMFENVTGKFDLVVFNPPYLPIGEDEGDITYSGGSSGREIIELFVSHVKNYLNKNGVVLMVISSLTGEKEVIDLFKEIGMNAKSVARKKVSWEELVVIGAN